MQPQQIFAGTALREYIQSFLYELDWLPVEYWIQFKVMDLTFKALSCLGPWYL